MTRDQFVQLANSFVARLLVYNARTRAERAAVNWNEVIKRVDAGIKTDFAPSAQSLILWDDWKRLVARLRTVGRPSDFGRPAYDLIGPADSTNGYVNWVATPLTSRVGFQMRTKDRRIQGAGGPTRPASTGSTRTTSSPSLARGAGHYYYLRNGTGTTWEKRPTGGDDRRRDLPAQGRVAHPARARRGSGAAHQQDAHRQREASRGHR
jgi:hypothetical protein